MTGLEIRKAGITDLPVLMEWRMRVLREVFGGSPAPDWALLRGRSEAYYREHLADGTHTACFAWLDGGITGCGGICYQREMPSPDNPSGTCGYLMNVFCVPELRGQGIGREIVWFLLADAWRRGTGKIYLESSQAARGLYEKLGFHPMRDYLMLPESAGGNPVADPAARRL